MRPDVNAFAAAKPGGPHLVEEDEGTDHRPLLAWKRPVDLESAKVVSDRRNRHRNRIVHAGCLRCRGSLRKSR